MVQDVEIWILNQLQSLSPNPRQANTNSAKTCLKSQTLLLLIMWIMSAAGADLFTIAGENQMPLKPLGAAADT